MNETIILAPGLNGTEFLRTLAKFGLNTIGLRVMNPAELAKEALIRTGISFSEGFLRRKDEPSFIDSFIRSVSDFSSMSYCDSEQMAAKIFEVRNLCPDEAAAFEKLAAEGEFRDKNRGLKEIFEKYRTKLSENNLLDTIGLIKLACEQAETLGCDFKYIKEYPLSPLEKELLEKVSGGAYVEVDFLSLFRRDASAVHIEKYTEAYGVTNEIESILAYIFENSIPVDQCEIVICGGREYSETLYNCSREYEIPMTIGSGLPIINSNPAKLLKLIYTWDTTGYHGVDALTALLTSECFDRNALYEKFGENSDFSIARLRKLAKIAGNLKLGFSKSENDKLISEYAVTEKDKGAKELVPYLFILSDELTSGIVYLIRSYSIIRESQPGRLDKSAVNVISEGIESYLRFADSEDLSGLIPELLDKTVSSEISREGSLYITGMPMAAASLRPYVFIAGLSSNLFPGSPREHYLLLDSDYLLLGNAEDVPTSDNVIRKNKRQLDDLLNMASGLGSRIFISYSGYSLTELKAQNPSSVLFDIYRKEHGAASSLKDFESSIERVGYFDSGLSPAFKLGRAYIQGDEIISGQVALLKDEVKVSLDREFSPTVLDRFFACPRKFYLSYALGIEEPEADDPFEVISALDYGNLAHSLMEELAKNPMDRSEFEELAGKRFDEFLKLRPALDIASCGRKRADFVNTMLNAYDQDREISNEVVSSEYTLRGLHPSGVKLKGRADRIEKNDLGEHIVVDYKTGRKIAHAANDIDTCLQAVIYSFLLRNDGYAVGTAEYRYLRSGRIVTCEYGPYMESLLNERLTQFREAVDNQEFPPTPSADSCKYCPYGDFCGKEDM